MTQISIYLKEIDREARRNALIRNKRKEQRQESDIFGYDAEISRMAAHLDRRIDRTTRNKWYALSCRLQRTDAEQITAFRNGLEKAKEDIRKERRIKTRIKHGV